MPRQLNLYKRRGFKAKIIEGESEPTKSFFKSMAIMSEVVRLTHKNPHFDICDEYTIAARALASLQRMRGQTKINARRLFKVEYFGESTTFGLNNTQSSRFNVATNIKQFIRERRQQMRAVEHEYRHYDIAGSSQMCGGVHLYPNFFLGAKKQLKKTRIRASKTPKSSDAHIGVELEFISTSSRSEIEDSLCDADLESYCQLTDDGSIDLPNSECYGDCRFNYCNCCSCCRCGESECGNNNGTECDEGADCECDCECDCDCGGNYHGHELRVIATEKEMPRVIKRICKVLSDHGCEVNHSCGMHVHLDMRNRDPELAFKALSYSQFAIAKVVPSSRRSNSYCKLEHNFELANISGDRYHAINANSLNAHGTIEVRLHSATLNARKINSWIELLIRISHSKQLIESCDKGNNAPETIFQLAQKVSIPKRLYRFYLDRQRQFNNPNNQERESA